jgi:hypothetical protein
MVKPKKKLTAAQRAEMKRRKLQKSLLQKAEHEVIVHARGLSQLRWRLFVTLRSRVSGTPSFASKMS